jgi:glutamate racemase
MSTIGIFDSGIGGLTVWRALREQLPHTPMLYVADQAHVPYGARPPAEICALSTAITRFLLAQGADVIVVACNTATAAALTHLRQTFPDVPFVGMEPAVKPAAALTKTGVVGALATANTFKSQRYASLLARFAGDVVLVEDACVGLVERIERGELATAETASFLRAILAPMLAQGVDVLILGCTHYPFVRPLLEQIAGPDVVMVDPAPAVARQVAKVLDEGEGREPIW